MDYVAAGVGFGPTGVSNRHGSESRAHTIFTVIPCQNPIGQFPFFGFLSSIIFPLLYVAETGEVFAHRRRNGGIDSDCCISRTGYDHMELRIG